MYLQYRRWAIHGTTFRIITDRIIRIWSYIRIIHEWKVSFNKRKKDTVENENRITKSTYTLSLCDTWSLIRNFYCVLRILHYEKKLLVTRRKELQFFLFFFLSTNQSIKKQIIVYSSTNFVLINHYYNLKIYSSLKIPYTCAYTVFIYRNETNLLFFFLLLLSLDRLFAILRMRTTRKTGKN